MARYRVPATHLGGDMSLTAAAAQAGVAYRTAQH